MGNLLIGGKTESVMLLGVNHCSNWDMKYVTMEGCWLGGWGGS